MTVLEAVNLPTHELNAKAIIARHMVGGEDSDILLAAFSILQQPATQLYLLESMGLETGAVRLGTTQAVLVAMAFALGKADA